ncbi:MAG: sensor histidine kinase, partial [Pseudomonas sp.]|nr:sensor histidine kinase [Pseudomonas sp.]
MHAKQPFARRILLAFVLMTIVVSGLFSLSIVAVVHLVEEHLVSQEMHRELREVLTVDLRKDKAPRLDAGMYFFSSQYPGYAIPEEYSHLPEGFTELVGADQAFYVYKINSAGHTHMLVQKQDEFEAHENILFGVVLAGFLLAVLGAWGLGLGMARKVMAPVRRLAQQVR